VTPSEQVSNLINCLTNDEDQRQELWVHYLSGNPVESFASHLKQLRLDYEDDVVVKKSLWTMMYNPPSPMFFKFLENFTEFEKQVIALLMLDLDIPKISQYKGISEVRIRQAVASIRYNSCWENYYGTKEESNRR
jgi:hypothetical protein